MRPNFIEYFNNLTQERLNSKGNYGNWDSVLKHLKKYTGDSISFENIDTQFCKGFKEYLEKAKTKSGKILSNVMGGSRLSHSYYSYHSWIFHLFIYLFR